MDQNPSSSAAHSTPDDLLHEILQNAVDSIECASHATISLVNAGGVATLMSSERHDAIEHAVSASGDGPALHAMHTGEVIRVTSTAADGPWPEFRRACIREGISSAAAFPIVAEETSVGALTIYSSDHHGFGAFEIRCGRHAAIQISKALPPAAHSARPTDG